jgi:gliding motility-associated-like protein
MPQPKPLNTAITIKLAFALLFFFFYFYSNSQTLNWAFKAGGNSRDESTNIHIDNAGNILMTGLFSGTVDFDPSAAVFNLTSAGSEDIFVAKYTSTGAFVWAFRIGGVDRDHGLGITCDPNNNVIVTGFFRGSNIDFDPSATTANLTSNGDAGADPGYGGDMFVAKYTSAGNYLWAFNVGGSELYDSGIAVVSDAASNIYVGGYFKGPVDFDPSAGTSILNSSSGTIFLSKYSSTGNYQWAFNTGLGDNNNAIFDLKTDNTGNVYVAGYFQGTNIDFDPSPAINALSSNGGYEIFFAKYTTNGQYVFAKSIGGSGNDVARGIDIDNNGNIYLIGDFNGTNIDFNPGAGTALLSSNGAEDVFLAKFTNAGNYVWAFNFGSGASDIGWKVSTDNSHLFVTGGFTGTSDMNPSAVVDNLVSNGGNDIFLGKYNLNGEYLCAFNIGGPFDDYGSAIRTAGPNIFYLTGFFQGNNVDFDPAAGTFPLSSAGGNDIFLSKFTWPDNTPPDGTISAGPVCSGQQAQLVFNATAGTGPFTIVYNNGTSNITVNNVQSGVPFNITPNPTVTTTYTLVSIRDASRCSETRQMNGVTATVIVSNCTVNCTYWPVFGTGYTSPIPYSNTVSFSYSNPGSLLANTAYSTMTPGNWFTPNPTIATTSPPNSTPHNTSDVGAITIYPTVVNNFGTISFASPTTTGFYLHVYQTVSRLDFDHSFSLISSDGDLQVGSSGSLVNNVLIPNVSPSQSPDDANATIYFPAGISQLKFTITSAPDPSISDDGIKLAFTFPDDCFTPTTTIINDYTPVLSLDPCKNIINVGDASAFKIGDTVLMIQMKGAVIDSTNTNSFGTVTNYKNAGNYEFNYIKSKNGNSIELLNKIERQYDLPDGKVQLIRVPYFQNYTIPNTSVLSCLSWNGTIGGVLVFNVQNNFTLNGSIDVSGKGFRGGIYNMNPVYTCDVDSFYLRNNNGSKGANKGESIFLNNTLQAGRGKAANGGGGGNSTNAGGAGGGNGGTGGSGGKQFGGPLTCNTNFANGGIGGANLSYSNVSNKIFLGGGGGAGHGNEVNLGNGGNGGGIVIITANTINANTYSILSNGATPVVVPISPNDDGRSGGGGGGTVLLNYQNLLGSLNVSTTGGNGDNTITSTPTWNHGPGGGGGGGVVWVNKPTIGGGLSINLNGGVNGVNTNLGNNPWGATAGTNGISLTNLVLPITATLFKVNIDSVRIKDSATGCASFDFKGLAYTNTSPISTWQWYFGDGGTSNTQNTTHTYSTTGAFTVKLVVTDINGCKDSITRNVTSSVLDFDFNYSQNVCNPLSVQFFPAGQLLANPYWSFGDGNTSSAPAPIHVFSNTGNYIVKYALSNGVCIDTVIKAISINIIPADIILTPDTTICKSTTKKLRTVPSLNFCWTPSTYLDNPNLREPTTSTPQAITYYYTAEVTGNNIIVNGDFSNGNNSFTSEYNYATPNVTEGQYYVGTNPQAWNASLSPCSDHTTGNGNMMLVNGSPTAGVNVWKQTVTVTPNTNYAFSTWIQALWPPNPAQLQFSINGKTIGNIITASLPTCTWSRFYTTWNSGNNTSAVISIVNINTQVQGNDFALDDISFAPVFIKRDSVRISVDSPFVRTNNDTTVCQGSTVQLNAIGSQTYSWSPSSGLSNSSIANPVATITSSSQYIVSGTSASGCVAKDTVNIGAYSKPLVTTTNDTSICRNTSVQLFASGGISYSWSPSSTLSNPSIANPVATPTANTIYYVTVTDANTCTNTDSVNVSFRNVAQFSASSALAICQNGSVQLNASGGNIYSWSPASTLSNPTISNPIASPLTSTNYSVTITESSCNESTTLVVPVTVRPLPSVNATRSNDVDCLQNTARLNATGAVTYKWTPAINLSNPNISNPIATPTTTTLYTVEGTDASGCKNTDTISVKVDFSNKNGLFLVPNAFTPNNDGLNDCFGIKHWGVLESVEFNIYNRWGELVFHTTDVTKCWDGKWKGRDQDPAVFVYWIKAKSICGGDVFRKGTVVLIR